MVVFEVVAFLFLLAMAVAVTLMAVVGLLGVTGVMRLKRCPTCAHLLPCAASRSTSCPYCAHPRLLHHFAHARIRHYLPGDG